jgi:hypothetical protein
MQKSATDALNNLEFYMPVTPHRKKGRDGIWESTGSYFLPVLLGRG